jgi:hypothetical protein
MCLRKASPAMPVVLLVLFAALGGSSQSTVVVQTLDIDGTDTRHRRRVGRRRG